jgi:glycosyltransferase involved in cell wall biosynthesis
MKLAHWMRQENSGLAYTTLELVEEEERQGHAVSLREPSTNAVLYGFVDAPDLHLIHSQIHPSTYHDGIPKLMWMHGEPLGSVGNGISMRAIVDLAPLCEAFLCMRREEQAVWNSIRRTYWVPKGIDLQRFKPLEGVKKLSGTPAVLYYENWRGQRNPLYLCRAMETVSRVLPEAKLHLYNCPGGKMAETFQTLIDHCRWATFIGSLKRSEPDVNTLLNRADIVVSGLYPLYARGIEAFGAGKAFIGPGYREPGYPWMTDLDPMAMADTILRCWQGYQTVDYRQWAETHHNIETTVQQAVDVYKRYTL